MGELENRPVAIARPSECCRAIEIAQLIRGKLSIGAAAVVFCGVEIVEDGLSPRAPGSRRQFEDDASAVSSSLVCRAIEIACLIEDNFAPGALPVIVAVEKAMGHAQAPPPGGGRVGRQLKD